MRRALRRVIIGSMANLFKMPGKCKDAASSQSHGIKFEIARFLQLKISYQGFGISTAIQTAGTFPVLSAQCVVARPSANPSPGFATRSGLPSWW